MSNMVVRSRLDQGVLTLTLWMVTLRGLLEEHHRAEYDPGHDLWEPLLNKNTRMTRAAKNEDNLVAVTQSE